MITDRIIGFLQWVFQGFLDSILALVPPMPSWVSDALDQFGAARDFVGSFDTWIPVATAVVVGSGLLLMWATVLGMHIARQILSYLTLGGGAYSK